MDSKQASKTAILEGIDYLKSQFTNRMNEQIMQVNQAYTSLSGGALTSADIDSIVNDIKSRINKLQQDFENVEANIRRDLNTSADTIRSAMEQNTLPFPLGFYVSHDNRSAFFIYRGLLEQFKMKVRGENNY